MNYIDRHITPRLDAILARGKSVLLLGPRQTGKTTLLKQCTADLNVSFIYPRDRLRYEMDPNSLADEVHAITETKVKKPLVIVDEVQKIPVIMDVVQGLIDEGTAQFILTGSSSRKLKHGHHINLLPGRLIPLHLSPLTINEIPAAQRKLQHLLLYGTLPEIITTPDLSDKEELLRAYVTLYLEEEIRTEALVRNIAHFARFLELAASESGLPVNYSKVSQDIGVAHTTIAQYYQILEDCLIAIRVEPISMSKTRHKLSKSKKFIFFDLGLRRVAAQEGINPTIKHIGYLFEQFIGLELIKQTYLKKESIHIKYWRDLDGPEVDWVIDKQDLLIPIEVKHTNKPHLHDARHLQVFLNEYRHTEHAYIICSIPRKMKLHDNIFAIPWQDISELF